MADYSKLATPGYYDIAQTKLATVVTHLEMLSKPNIVQKPASVDVELQAWPYVDLLAYRTLYQHVGEQWLWCSRLSMPNEELFAIVNHPQVDVYAVMHDGHARGLLELDYRCAPDCEIAFFGLGNTLIGHGIGGWLMRQAIELAWSRPIKRLWVHTCTFDHPNALGFYQYYGFKPFKQQIEIMGDPRLDGTLPRHAAQHVPIIGASNIG